MNGFICLNKPQEITSFTAVNRLRKLANEKKAGHTGTLDPLATGVLPIALGAATRFIELLPKSNKAYQATLLLGKTTDTLDITGKVLSENTVRVTKEEFLKALEPFRGEVLQLPPAYSAISKNGVRLYELARQGIEVEREKRPVTISKLELFDARKEKNEYRIAVECSAGTYIRSLIADIGDVLGCGAVMTALERTASNGFLLENSHTLKELEERSLEGSLEAVVQSVDSLMIEYPAIHVTPAQGVRFKNGGELDLTRINCNGEVGYYRVYSKDLFLGVGEVKADHTSLWVKRVYTA